MAADSYNAMTLCTVSFTISVMINYKKMKGSIITYLILSHKRFLHSTGENSNDSASLYVFFYKNEDTFTPPTS